MRICASVVTSVMLMLSQPAFAQSAATKAGPSGAVAAAQSVDPARAGMIRKTFARCVYVNARRNADKLLLHSDIFSVDAKAAGVRDYNRDLNARSCMGKDLKPAETDMLMQVKPQLLRDLLAEEAYLARHSGAPISIATPVPFVFKPTALNTDLVRSEMMARLGDCGVVRDPAGADALLRTVPASEAERVAAIRLASAFGGCLVQGQTVSLTASTVRTLAAYAMWTRYVRPSLKS